MANEKRLIDLDKVKPMDFPSCEMDGLDVVRYLNTLPTVDAVEVVHGHWRYYSTTMQECSNCHRHTARHKFKYCPHCGALMEDKYNDG